MSHRAPVQGGHPRPPQRPLLVTGLTQYPKKVICQDSAKKTSKKLCVKCSSSTYFSRLSRALPSPPIVALLLWRSCAPGCAPPRAQFPTLPPCACRCPPLHTGPGSTYRHDPSSTYADRLLWRQCCLPRIGTCLAALSSTTGCSQPPRHDAWAGLPTLAPTAALHSPADIAKLLPTPAGAALNALATDARPPWRQPPPPPPGPPLSQRPTPPRRIVHQIRGEWLERALSTKIEVNSYNANCCLNRLNYCLPCPC
jgi:hypothetical protein